MFTEDEVYNMLKAALEETQKDLTVQHAFSPALGLLGAEGALDSLDTMIFLDLVDQRLAEKTGQEVVLASEDAFAREDSPFLNMRALNEYIRERFNEE